MTKEQYITYVKENNYIVSQLFKEKGEKFIDGLIRMGYLKCL